MSAIYVFIFYCSEIAYFSFENRNMKCGYKNLITDVLSMNKLCNVPTD